MKNFNIKAIAIALLIIICGAACFLISHPSSSAADDEKNTELLISFLSKHGIKVADTLLPEGRPKVYEASASNELSDKSLFAEKLFGGTAAMNNSGTEFTFGSDKLIISSTKFSYTAKSLPDKALLGGITIDNAGKKAKETAEIHGFDLSGSIINCSEDKGVYTAVITKSFYGLPIFNDTMTFTMSADGLRSIDGIWFSASSEKKRGAKEISSALIELINDPEFPGNAEITDIELGYVLLDPNMDETKLKPIWRVTLSDGKIFSVNA